MYRVAVIGCGMIGTAPVRSALGVQSHAAGWADRADATIVALADPDPTRLAAAARHWGVASVFSDPAALLRAVEPDIVSVCTPDDTHGAILEAVLGTRSVRAVLAEKPLALDAEEAARLVETAATRNVTLAVNYGRRTHPSHRRLAQWLAQEPLGPIEVVRGGYVRGIKHNGTHWIDLARMLAGEIEDVEGRGPVSGTDVDATVDVTLGFESGARGSLTGVRSGSYGWFEIELIGPRGRVRVLDGGRQFEVETVARSNDFDGFEELRPGAGPTGGLENLVLHAVTDLVDSLERGRIPNCSAENALIALRLADRALETARAGQPRGRPHAALHR